MPGSYARYSDLFGMGYLLDSAVFKGFLGDCNMQQRLRASAPATCHGFALCVLSIFFVGWPCTVGHRMYQESVVITTGHQHEREQSNY